MEPIVIASVLILTMHFVYEAVILPSLQKALSQKILMLRHQLIETAISGGQNISIDDLNGLLSFLDQCQRRVHRVNFFMVLRKQHTSDERCPPLSKSWDSALSPEVTRCKASATRYVLLGFLANSAMLILYLLPLMLCGGVVLAMLGSGERFVSLLIQKLRFVTVPDNSIYDGLTVPRR